MPEKLKILFLCTGNACRGQMAEGQASKSVRGKPRAEPGDHRPTHLTIRLVPTTKERAAARGSPQATRRGEQLGPRPADSGRADYVEHHA